MSEIEYVTYSRDLRGALPTLGPGGHLSAAFGVDGQCSLMLTANLDGRDEIGLYRGRLPAATVQALVKLLHESRYEGTGPITLRPDTPTMSVGEAAKGAAAPAVRAFSLDAVPATLAPYETAARQAVEALFAHPDRVVRGRASLAGGHAEAGKPLAFQISLENIGATPLALRNPTQRQAEIPLRIAPATGDAISLAVKPDAISNVAGPPSRATKRVVLQPKEALTFTVEARPSLRPGSYQAALTFDLGPSPGQPAALEGQLTVHTPPFEIRGR